MGLIWRLIELFVMALELSCDWLATKISRMCIQVMSSSETPVVRWKKPFANHLKSGEFICCASSCYEGLVQVREIEATGLREALSWIERLGHQSVIFELDINRLFMQ
ncbi:conserved hypothetical protein [Ricinus communis]|uniref:RNase H type-1 domain-containing protein n=1 Tax=Ricinus communis TaxID=3988 RepID=B9S2H2_RICCO|nr:conserved hypothetical protein [Ricinus communis]